MSTRHRGKRSFWRDLQGMLTEISQSSQAPTVSQKTIRPKPVVSANPTPQEWHDATAWMISMAFDTATLLPAAQQIASMAVHDPQNGYVMADYIVTLFSSLMEKAEQIYTADETQREPLLTMVRELRSVVAPSTPEPVQVRDGAAILDDVEKFIERFVAYPSDAARIAHVLWIAHTWFMDSWEATPRLAFLSTEPGSGKSRCLEVTEPLVPRPIHAVNVTPTYMFRKISDPAGLPTILFDEVDTVFNTKGGGNETLRGVLNAGYRRGATAGRCSAKGIEELPAYCAVALAGLGNLPDTIMTRSVIIRLRRRPADVTVEPWRPREVSGEAGSLYRDLQAWSEQRKGNLAWPDLPAGIADRNADVWEPLIAIADLAGGAWPKMARTAALYLIHNR